MFKIGDFSRLSQVTVKALRYYDDIGLFKPSYIEILSGYRYYSAEQMSDLNRIIALRNLGFSLEQVALMKEMPISQIREMMINRREQIKKQLEHEQERLLMIETRLEILEREDVIMADYDVVIKQIQSQKVIGKRSVIPNYSSIHELFSAVCEPLATIKVNYAGPPLAIYYDGEYKEKDVDVEVVMPVLTEDKQVAGFMVRELPGIEQAACLIHRGSFENLHFAYSALMKWVDDNGYQIAGPDREVYLVDPDECNSPDEYVTELQLPIEKVK
ncbi:transcriptional regulator, merr family [hydrocarbon metagenome]|uniref:Transcriptional regulator, merr family n=1 Tax=hydrocarbon metagenome TaxID=938273 RepID=A0A0W8E1H5_9ZZZZ